MENQNPNPLPVTTPEAPKKKMISNKILVIIILAIIAGILSWIYLQKQPAVDTSPIVMHKQEKVEVKSEVKTYKNDEYGFEFEYPDDWYLSTEEKSFISLDSPESKKQKESGCVECGSEINIWINPNPKNLKVKDFYNGEDAVALFDGNPPLNELIIAGKTVYKVHPAEGIAPSTNVIIPVPGAYVMFETYGNDESNVNKILSTFKFTNTETGDWKTYKNDKYGFELQFPENNWKKLDIAESDKDGIHFINFKLPNELSNGKYASVFIIGIYNPTAWNLAKQGDVNIPEEIPNSVGNKTGLFFGYTNGQDDYGFEGFEDYNKELSVPRSNEYLQNTGPFDQLRNQILPTFKFNTAPTQLDTQKEKPVITNMTNSLITGKAKPNYLVWAYPAGNQCITQNTMAKYGAGKADENGNFSITIPNNISKRENDIIVASLPKDSYFINNQNSEDLCFPDSSLSAVKSFAY